MGQHITLFLLWLVISGVFLQGGGVHKIIPVVQRLTSSVTNFWGHCCCCLCIRRYSPAPVGLGYMVGVREVMFNEGLAKGTATVEAVGVWSEFLHHKLSFDVVSVFPLASEL